MNEWILICNSKYFDLKKAFEIRDSITWPLTDEIAVGDVVFFYVTNPYRAILYKGKVENVALHHMDDASKECVTHALFYEGSQAYMQIRKIAMYPENLLTDEELQKNGIQSLQTTRKAPRDLDQFIAKKEEVSSGKSKRKLPVKGVIVGIAAALAVLALVVCVGIGGSKKPEQQSDLTANEETVGTVQTDFADHEETAGIVRTDSVDDEETAGIVTADQTTIFVGESTGVVFETDGYTYRNDESLTWSSSDDNIATVDENGNVTGVSEGLVLITGQLHDQTSSVSITVEEQAEDTDIETITFENSDTEISIDHLEIYCHSEYLLAGDSIDVWLKTDSLIIDGRSAGIAWSTDNSNVLSVSDEGILTAIAPGTCTLMAEYEGKTVSKKIEVVDVDNSVGATVTADYEKISLNSGGKDTVILTFGGNMPAYYRATVYYSTGVSLKLEWGEWGEMGTLPLTIEDYFSEGEQGYVTILVNDREDPTHFVASTKINVRISK